jgi:hypothetical protein
MVLPYKNTITNVPTFCSGGGRKADVTVPTGGNLSEKGVKA